MGVVLPQLAPASEDRVSGAQVFDGSLRFDKAKKLHLTRTPGSSGNQKTWTLSFWFKKQNMGDQRILFNSFTDNSNRVIVRFLSDKLQFALQSSGTFYGLQTDQVFQDNGWYHVVLVLDTTQNNETSRQRIYVNGDKIADGDLANNSISGSNKYPTKDATFNTNTTVAHYIGANNESSAVQDTTFDGQISNAYLIDGLAIAPAFFGYTDPLTNTWRPRGKLKKTVNDGTDFTADITNTGGTLNNKSRIFDGTIDSDATIASGAATITYTPSTPIKYTDSVRVMGSGSPSNPYNARWQLNGGSDVSTVNANEFVTLDEGNGGGTITSIKLTVDAGGANWRAIQVDGVIMKASAVTSIEFGTNGYYLPFDGNTSIGEDRSGKGNNWTPVNFGGSNSVEKATGAKPILNTLGGNIARPGVFGSDAGAYYHTTSASNSGGKYVFEDQGTQPTFSFIRGATYVFDWSASTSHPLRFSTTTEEGGGTATSYSDGVDVTGNVTTITVPHNAPDTLYYYCNVHPGMGNSISVTTDETKADPYAWKNVLALPLTGNVVDVSASITCTSTKKTIANNGTIGVTTSSNFYNGSTFFDGVNDQINVTASGELDLGANDDWTYELWFNSTTVSSGWAIADYNGNDSATGDPGGQIYFSASSGAGLHWYQGSSRLAEIPKEEIQANKWHHVAFVKDGTANTITSFLDGIQKASSSFNGSSGSTSNGLNIGQQGGGTWFKGYMSDFRVYKGIKKYTSNFIPASSNPDIRPDSPSGVAVKSKLTEVTDGSVSFDGINGTDGDFLATYTSSSELSFGTGDFTVEMFLYNEETAGKGFIQFSDTEGGFKATNSGVITIHKENGINGAFRAYAKNTSTAFSTPVPFKRWCHVALTRESGTIKLFVDGKQDATTISSDTTNYATTYVAIGGYYDTDYLSKCSISNVRVNKGTAVYTRDFKPPTRQLTNISGTKLLCCHSNSQPGAGITAPNMGGVNSGVQWSAGAGPNFEANNPARDGFNGKENSNTRTDNADVTATINFPVPVAFSSTLKVRGARDSGNGLIKLIGGNGTVDVSSQFTSSSASLETVTITGVTSPLKGISLTGVSGSAQPRFSAIYIDDVMLVDPITPNGDVSVSSNAARINKATSFNPFTTDIDTVQGQSGSYCTMSDVSKTKSAYFVKDGGLTVGNSDAPSGSSGSRGHIRSSIGMKTGKWYAEVTSFRASDGDIDFGFGLFTADNSGFWNTKGTINYKVNGKLQAPSGLNQTYGTSSADGDCIGIKVDLDSVERTVEFSKNGAPMGPVGITTTHELFFGYGSDGGGAGRTYTTKWNFGQKPFKYPPRDGFQPLTSTALRPESVIARSDQYVGVTTYSGNETSQSVTNFNMKPDLVWIKNMDDGVSNMIYDSVRGANNYLRSDTTNTQDSGSANQVSFIPRGFSLSGGGGGVNDDGKEYVCWSWKAGGNKGTFNLDDVGYSSASSVGMNVGGQNSNYYNQTAVWTNRISSPTTLRSGGGAFAYGALSTIFDGDLSTGAGAQSGNLTLNFDPPISTHNSTVSIYAYHVYGATITTDKGTFTSMTVGKGGVNNWLTARGVTGDITSILISGSGSVGTCGGIEIDGKLLADQGVTPTNVPTIASTGSSVGTKQGFSIVQYTGNSTAGATVAHGLSQTPDFVIVKQISGTNESWRVRHKDSGNLLKTLYLNGTAGNSANTEWISHANAATITLSNDADGINSSSNYIVYSWHDVPGLQKFGSYVGTADSNGPVLETGFRPALVVLKKTTEDGDPWIVYDAARNSSNLATSRLQWNNNNNQSVSVDYAIDILSNGFKIRTSDVSWNDAGERFIYMAWAEAPSFNLFGAQSNAR